LLEQEQTQLKIQREREDREKLQRENEEKQQKLAAERQEKMKQERIEREEKLKQERIEREKQKSLLSVPVPQQQSLSPRSSPRSSSPTPSSSSSSSSSTSTPSSTSSTSTSSSISISSSPKPVARILSGPDALLYWAKTQCESYGIEVTNFTSCWKDGLAFCALVHAYFPKTIDFNACKAKTPTERLTIAFDIAGEQGVPPLLDPEDVCDVTTPDRRSIMTYVSCLYKGFRNT